MRAWDMMRVKKKQFGWESQTSAGDFWWKMEWTNSQSVRNNKDIGINTKVKELINLLSEFPASHLEEKWKVFHWCLCWNESLDIVWGISVWYDTRIWVTQWVNSRWFFLSLKWLSFSLIIVVELSRELMMNIIRGASVNAAAMRRIVGWKTEKAIVTSFHYFIIQCVQNEKKPERCWLGEEFPFCCDVNVRGVWCSSKQKTRMRI